MTTPGVDLDYRGDLEIDKHDLPGAWEIQPQLYMKWAEEHAYAVQVRDQAKDNLDLVRANLDSAVRADPAAYGFTAKPTEAAIGAVILQQDQYGDAVTALHEVNKNVNLLAGAKSAMEHKKRALENLTTLAVNEFYHSAGQPSQAAVAHSKKGQSRQKRQLNQ